MIVRRGGTVRGRRPIRAKTPLGVNIIRNIRVSVTSDGMSDVLCDVVSDDMFTINMINSF